MKNIVSVLFIVIGSLLLQSCGLNYYAEQYHVNVTENELIDKIKQFKLENEQYKCIQVGDSGESYDPGFYYNPFERDSDSPILTENSRYYVFYFFLPDIPATLHCSIRVDSLARDAIGSVLFLKSIIYGSDPIFRGGWKTINDYKTISREENKMIKKKFEDDILNKLGITWRHKKCGNKSKPNTV